MNQYIVSLIDRVTNETQTILVLSEHPNQMQEFVDRVEDLKIKNPVVVDIVETTVPLVQLNSAEAV